MPGQAHPERNSDDASVGERIPQDNGSEQVLRFLQKLRHFPPKALRLLRQLLHPPFPEGEQCRLGQCEIEARVGAKNYSDEGGRFPRCHTLSIPQIGSWQKCNFQLLKVDLGAGFFILGATN